jgi:hypothetical protein
MFASQKKILFISGKTIRMAQVSGTGKSQKVKLGADVPWAKETLTKTLFEIKKTHGGPFSVVLGDDISFTFAVAVPLDTESEREYVRIKAAEEIPEELGDYGWDFKEVLESPGKKEKLVQFISADDEFYKVFSAAVRDSGIKIEAVESVSCALARQLTGRAQPMLVFHIADNYLVFLCQRGLVFTSQNFDAEPTSREITAFLGFAEEKFGIIPMIALLSGVYPTLNGKTADFTKFKVETFALDPFLGIAIKRDSGGKDEISLNIPIVAAAPTDENKLQKKIVGISEISKNEGDDEYKLIGQEQDELAKYPRRNFFTYLILALSVLVALINGIILYQRNQSEKITNVPNAIVVREQPVESSSTIAGVAETASSSAASTTQSGISVDSSSVAVATVSIPANTTTTDLQSYGVEILNGSGISGAAVKMKDLLEANGFKVVDTANADNFNYKNTLVRYKDFIPSGYRDDVERALAIGYTIQRGTDLNSNEKVDVIITVGL